MLTAIISFSVCADTESAEYDGYIMKFKNDACVEIAMKYIENSGILAGEEDVFAEIYQPHDLYKTYDENLTEFFYELGLLEYSEPDALCYLFDYDYTADYYYKNYQSTWAHACSNAPGAWKYGVYGNDVKVAVLDSGVMATHEDLTGRVSEGFSLVTDSAANVAVIGHGTAVAGVIAAAANGKGIVGVAHRAQIIPIKVTDENSFPVSRLYLAVNEAISLDVDVINMSLGTTSNSTSLRNAINNAISKNILVVAASGNTSSYSQGSLVYPGYYDNVVNVGNVMKSGSNFVISSSSVANSGVTIAAPGTLVYTANFSSASSYARWSGTSFACPYVAGIAALAKSVDPDITQAEFMELLTSTADKSVLGDAEYANTYGYGIADAGALIEELIDRRQKGGFISPIDRTTSGEVNVKVYNPLDTSQSFSFFAKVQNADRPISFAYRPITLDAYGVTEIPLAALSGADTSNISCYILEPTKFRPLYKKIEA